MPHTDNDARARIRELNDAFRKSVDRKLRTFVLTARVNSLPSDVKASVVRDSLHRHLAHRRPYRTIMRTVTVYPAEQAPSPEPENDNPFSAAPANDNASSIPAASAL